jgi:hypothetical protein
MTSLSAERPGAQERHVQRRFNNPLFTPERRRASAVDIAVAEQADQEEQAQFFERFRLLVEEAAGLRPNEESETILALKERLDQAYEQCAGLRGDQEAPKAALKRLVELVMSAVRQGAGADPKALEELEREAEARALHYRLLEYPLVADLLRPDSPIGADELVPTLLSEPLEAMAAALQLFEKEQRAAIYTEARALLARTGEEGHVLPDASRRLEVMGESAGAD